MGTGTGSELIATVELISTAVQVCVGLIFATAAFGKLRHWYEFKGMLAAYRLLPSAPVSASAWLSASAWVPVAAVAIVVAESLVGVALIAGWETPRIAPLAAALFAGFAGAMALNLARGRRSIDCGCFQSVRQPLEWRLVVRNLLCAAAVLASGGFTLAAHDPQRWIQAVPAGAALFAIYLALNAVWALDASRAAAFTRA